MSKPQEIVILGGHFGAVSTAHYLLRHVFPALEKSSAHTASYHITLVAPHTHFFWNIAAPRHLCVRDLLQTSKMYLALEDAFQDYPAERFTFMQGKATAVNAKNRSVKVSLSDGRTMDVQYSALVITTGRRSDSALWQINDGGEENGRALAHVQDGLQTAKSVLIAGGGPIGVETAGEIASRHPHINVSLYSGSDRILPRLLPRTSATAEKQLACLGVRVIHGRRCKGLSETDKAAVTFESGPPESADIFIDATGGRPNSEFLPAEWLDSKGFVQTEEKSTRVLGPDAELVYAIGDVAQYSDGTLNGVFRAVPALGYALGTDSAQRMGRKQAFPVREYSAMQGTQLVPTGPTGGVGQLFGWRIPSVLVWMIKSRTFFVETAPGVVKGSSFRKP